MNDAERHDIQGEANTLDVSVVRAFHDRLDAPIVTDDPLAEVRALEEAKNAITARQARLAITVHEQQRAKDIARGIRTADTARAAGTSVALARRSSPHLGSRLLGLAHAVVEEMPHTYQALAAGVITERDVTALVAATSCLSREDRARVDEAVADRLGRVSHRELAAAAQSAAYTADPEGFTRRRAKAESERRVSLRPAPDCMTWLTALLPVKDGVACYAALKAQADATATPDHPRGQVMADTLVERITGKSAAGDSDSDSDGGGPDVHVNLLMPLDTLTGDTPAHVPGYGPIPADLAREWATGSGCESQVRRLFTYPGTGDVIGMESRARTYPGLLALLIRLRDQRCRTPYCDAPIAHIDHIQPHADGGDTSERNGQGTCEGCNYGKEHPDITVTGHAGETTTSIGTLTATSRPPAPPGQPPPTTLHLQHTMMTIMWEHSLQERDQDS